MKPQDKCLELIVDAWNEFLKIENKHPSDEHEMQHHIHCIQNILYAHKYKTEMPNNGMYGSTI